MERVRYLSLFFASLAHCCWGKGVRGQDRDQVLWKYGRINWTWESVQIPSWRISYPTVPRSGSVVATKLCSCRWCSRTALSQRVKEETSVGSPTILVLISLQGLEEETSFPFTFVQQAGDSIWSTGKQFLQLLALPHVSPIPLPPPAAWALSLFTQDAPQTQSC